MSANSTSNASFDFFLNDCFDSRTTTFIYLSFSMANIALLLPLLAYILLLGLEQRRRRLSSSEAMSHSDFFTYNVVALELLGMLGSCLYCFGSYNKDHIAELVGWSICSVTSPGQTLFHVLTSVERYLAVVHPVTYLGLRQAGGLRIRNLSAGCAWLLCVVLMTCSKYLSSTFGGIAITLFLVSSIAVVSVSGLSMLCVLNNGGPGQVSRARQRAFHTVLVIMAALMLRFAGILVCNVLFTSPERTHTTCAVGSAAIWLTLPCSLVLPLLFLHRAGKLARCKRNTEGADQSG